MMLDVNDNYGIPCRTVKGILAGLYEPISLHDIVDMWQSRRPDLTPISVIRAIGWLAEYGWVESDWDDARGCFVYSFTSPGEW